MGRAEGPHPGLSIKFHGAFDQRTNHTGLGRRHTTCVERAHGELGTRFTNRLGSHNANRFTQINQLVVG